MLTPLPPVRRPQRLPPLPYGEASSAYAAKFNTLMKEHGPKKPEPKKDAKTPKSPPHPRQAAQVVPGVFRRATGKLVV